MRNAEQIATLAAALAAAEKASKLASAVAWKAHQKAHRLRYERTPEAQNARAIADKTRYAADSRKWNVKQARRAYAAAIAAAAPVDATDWSHRAPLERWYEDFSADFEET